MSRFFFFIQEAFRALRRNGAPSMAAIVTTVVTVILLGVLIPIFQTTQAKSDRGARQPRNSGSPIYDDATKAEIAALQRQARSDPARRQRSQFISKAEALKELEEDLGKEKAEELTSQLSGNNPLPGELRGQAGRRRQPRLGARSDRSPPGPNGKPQPISPIVDENIFEPPGRTPEDRAGDRAR